jgi:hypothetical protein
VASVALEESMKAPSPPPAPDPAQVAGAQTAQNVSTAIAQGAINNVNQVTPYGNLTYEQTGTFQMTDPNTGKVYDVPLSTATQTLTPVAQRTVDAQMSAGENLAGIARDQSARIGDLLGTPLEMSNEAAESRLMELGRSRLDPALSRRRESEMNRLTQQGIMPGSKAFDRAMSRLDEGENDAYNQLMLTGRGQAMQELLTERNQPINETTALMSGSQVQQPSFVNTNPAQLDNVDRAGLEMDKYQGELNAYNTQMASRNSMMGGLFGLAGTLLSDARAKDNVQRIGETDDGQNIYSYTYKGDDTTHIGLMAQEVAKRNPDAVVRDPRNGLMRVDYQEALA